MLPTKFSFCAASGFGKAPDDGIGDAQTLDRLPRYGAAGSTAVHPVIPDHWPPEEFKDLVDPVRESGREHSASPDPAPQLDPADSELLARLRRNDSSAFATWIRRESPRLRAHARRILRHEEDARDAVQDGFLSAYRAIGRFDGRSSLSTWIHRIVVNAALMKLRWRRRRPEVALDEVSREREGDNRLASDLADTWSDTWDETAEDVALRRERAARIRAEIRNLAEPYRTVLTLRDLQGLDTRETAARTGVSTDLVKVRLHRARQALRHLLEPELDPTRG